jgi:hypothetical protein
MGAYYSRPDPCPYETWDYNKWKDPRYTNGMGRQITVAVPTDALRHTGLQAEAMHRFSTIQDRLIVAPRAYMMQTAMLGGDEALKQVTGR